MISDLAKTASKWTTPERTAQKWRSQGYSDLCRDMAPGGVDIWCARLDLATEKISDLEALLSTEEKARADRFRYPVHRRRFVASHGIARRILSGYLDIPPRDIRFSTGVYGKPQLDHPPGSRRLRFNLSHSHGLALYGITQNREIGIDVEYTGRSCNPLALARRFFSSDEADIIGNMPERDRIKAFFACWTRKEAFLKGLGYGLALPLNRFTVSVYADRPPVLLHTAWCDNEPPAWELFDIDAEADYAGAAAVKGGAANIRYFVAGFEKDY